MFHIDATFEDCRIVTKQRQTEPNVECLFDVTFYDQMSGKQWSQVMSLNDIGKLVMYACSGQDGENLPPVTYDECNRILNCAENKCPPECRPIP
jgi:hypothetical protein